MFSQISFWPVSFYMFQTFLKFFSITAHILLVSDATKQVYILNPLALYSHGIKQAELSQWTARVVLGSRSYTQIASSNRIPKGTKGDLQKYISQHKLNVISTQILLLLVEPQTPAATLLLLKMRKREVLPEWKTTALLTNENEVHYF